MRDLRLMRISQQSQSGKSNALPATHIPVAAFQRALAACTRELLRGKHSQRFRQQNARPGTFVPRAGQRTSGLIKTSDTSVSHSVIRAMTLVHHSPRPLHEPSSTEYAGPTPLTRRMGMAEIG